MFISVLRKTLLFTSTLLSLFLFTVSSVHSKSYTIGVEAVNHYPHYDFTGSEPRGYLVDLIKEFSSLQNIEVEFKVMGVDELWAAYLRREVDFRLPDNLLWQRELKKSVEITYSAPLAYYTDGVVGLATNKSKPLKVLGTIKGFTAWDYQGEIEAGIIELKTESTVEALIEGLLAGRYDGVYYNVEAFQKLVEEAGHDPESTVFRKDLGKTRSLYMMSSIRYGDLVKSLNQFLRSNKSWVRERKAFYKLK